MALVKFNLTESPICALVLLAGGEIERVIAWDCSPKDFGNVSVGVGR